MLGKLKIAALILLIPSISHADNFSVEKIGKHTLQIQKLRKREKFSFDYEISSYEVNCAKTIIAVWGEWHPYKKFHLQDRIAVKISVLDINANRVLGDFTVTRGPYRIQYKKNERAILVDAEDLVRFRNKKLNLLMFQAETETLLNWKIAPISL
ncbi:MAG: hypothetical protein EOP92_40880, partial [Lysobacteraceae bacterium]